MNAPHSSCLVLSFLLFLCLGCAVEEGDGTPSCQISDEVGDNEMRSRVDGSNWTASSSGYQVPGAVGFIAAFTVDAHNLMTVRLHHTSVFSVNEQGLIEGDEGDDVGDVFVAGAGPFEFSLGSANRDGGDVTLTVDDEIFHTDDGDGGGYLYIEEVEEGEGNNPDAARGCFYFDAGTDDSDQLVSVESGSFSVAEL